MLRIAQTYVYEHTYLECRLKTWLLSKTTSICSLLGSMTSLSMNFDHVYVIRHEFFQWSKFNIQSRELLVNSMKRLATIAAVSTSCLESFCCRMQSPALGKIIDAISSTAAFIAPSSLQKLNSSESFLVSSRLISLCPETNRHGVFSNKDF